MPNSKSVVHFLMVHFGWLGWSGGVGRRGWCGEREIRANLAKVEVEVEAELGNKNVLSKKMIVVSRFPRTMKQSKTKPFQGNAKLGNRTRTLNERIAE